MEKDLSQEFDAKYHAIINAEIIEDISEIEDPRITMHNSNIATDMNSSKDEIDQE